MSTLASISNLFGGDMWILLVIVLILFGAKKLPELARGMGQAIREFNKAKDEFEREITKPNPEGMVTQEPKHTLPHRSPEPLAAEAPEPVHAAAGPGENPGKQAS